MTVATANAGEGPFGGGRGGSGRLIVDQARNGGEALGVDLYGLFANEGPPAVHLPDYVPHDLVAEWVGVLGDLAMEPYSVTKHSPSGPAFFFGANLYDVRPEPDPTIDLAPYFEQADEDRERLASAFASRGLLHPINDVLVPLFARLQPGQVRLAAEPDGQSYYAGVVRATQNGIHLHVDDSPREAPELSIGEEVIGQVSALIYLDTPGDGSGALDVFHKRPTRVDYAWHKHPAYGFYPSAVRNTARETIVPSAGDVVIFDAWSLHRVAQSTPGTRRLTISAFFGLRKDGSLIFWS